MKKGWKRQKKSSVVSSKCSGVIEKEIRKCVMVFRDRNFFIVHSLKYSFSYELTDKVFYIYDDTFSKWFWCAKLLYKKKINYTIDTSTIRLIWDRKSLAPVSKELNKHKLNTTTTTTEKSNKQWLRQVLNSLYRTTNPEIKVNENGESQVIIIIIIHINYLF